MSHISEEQHQEYVQFIKSDLGEFTELRFDTVGSTIGKELASKAIWAFALVLFGISMYIAFAFRKVSYPIASWKYGFVTLLSLFHDVVVPAGLFSFLNYIRGVEIDINFLTALLVILGFSVHDTVVVFDRIRENLLLSRNKTSMSKNDLGDIINQSVNQTLRRSIFTSLTLFIVLIALMVFGPISLRYFVMTILVGTVVGSYSSIFIASPILFLLYRKK